MRVVFWQTRFWPDIGGAEVLGRHLVAGLAARGHDVVVVAAHGAGGESPDEADLDGTPVLRFPFFHALMGRDLPRVAATTRRLDERIARFRPDLVHVNSQDSDLFYLHRSRELRRAPCLLTVHSSSTFTGGENSLLGRTVSGAAWVACVSRAMLADTRAFCPGATARSSVVLNALPDTLPSSGPAPFPREAMLLALGRLVPEKGFDLVLDAISRVQPGVRLIVSGDGVHRPELERQAASLGISHRVTFTGWVPPDRVDALVDGATLVLVPSCWREPFGLVALQAAQRGRPVVASRLGGLPEIVVDGETGLLVDPTTEAFSSAVTLLLSRPDELERMGRAARERAVSVFRFDRFLDAYEELYARVAGR